MIVLSGKKRSGKDTVAGYMRDEGMKTYALADPIKEALLSAFRRNGIKMTMDALHGIGYDREQVLPLSTNQIRMILMDAVIYELRKKDLTADETAKCISDAYQVISTTMAPFSVRKFMQAFGTDIICFMISKNHWLDYTKDMSDVVITDVRQPWEEEYFREKDATFIFVVGAYDGYKEPVDNHITERGLTPRDGDEILINTDLETLAKETKCLLNKLMP